MHGGKCLFTTERSRFGDAHALIDVLKDARRAGPLDFRAKPHQLKEMKATMFQFGAGARTCIGKNISLLEIYKLVPTFLRNFEIELEKPGTEWKTWNAWFVRQLDFKTVFKRRDRPAAV